MALVGVEEGFCLTWVSTGLHHDWKRTTHNVISHKKLNGIEPETNMLFRLSFCNIMNLLSSWHLGTTSSGFFFSSSETILQRQDNQFGSVYIPLPPKLVMPITWKALYIIWSNHNSNCYRKMTCNLRSNNKVWTSVSLCILIWAAMSKPMKVIWVLVMITGVFKRTSS